MGQGWWGIILPTICHVTLLSHRRNTHEPTYGHGSEKLSLRPLALGVPWLEVEVFLCKHVPPTEFSAPKAHSPLSYQGCQNVGFSPMGHRSNRLTCLGAGMGPIPFSVRLTTTCILSMLC